MPIFNPQDIPTYALVLFRVAGMMLFAPLPASEQWAPFLESVE